MCHPPALAGAGATPEGSEAGEAAGPPLAAEDRQLIRQELLLGHLLTLAASSGAVPPHALPSIAGMLQAEGLMPKWLAFTLTQQPALFDRAFHRVFHQVGWLAGLAGLAGLLAVPEVAEAGEAAGSSVSAILPCSLSPHLRLCLHLLLPSLCCRSWKRRSRRSAGSRTTPCSGRCSASGSGGRSRWPPPEACMATCAAGQAARQTTLRCPAHDMKLTSLS
jgi:hypothetical protein